MNHFDALSEAAHATSFMPNVNLTRTEEAIHAFLDQHPIVDGGQLSDALAGDSKVSLIDLRVMGNCLENSSDKHVVKFGALALLTALAWEYDPPASERGNVDRNSAAAMACLAEFIYSGSNKVADTAHKVAARISVCDRDMSTEEAQMSLLTHHPLDLHNKERTNYQVQEESNADEIISIEDENICQKVAEFPWIDTPAENIELNARLVRGLNDIDVLIADLTAYSSQMQPILADARAFFDESIFRSMEMGLISKLLTGNQSGYVQPPSFRDPKLPDSYFARNVGSNSNLRRLYIARIGEYDGMPVFARLGFSRTKQNQSTLSQLLGYYPVRS